MNIKETYNWCVKNKNLIRKIIYKYDKNLENLDDNYNEIILKLFEVCHNFNPNKGASFTTYAYYVLDREMLYYNRKKRCELSYPKYILTNNEAYKKHNPDKDKFQPLYKFEVDKDFSFEDRFSSELRESIDKVLDRMRLKYLVTRSIEFLPPKQKKVMQYKYDSNFVQVHSSTEAAREFGTSVAAVSKNEKDAIRNIKKMIGVIINND